MRFGIKRGEWKNLLGGKLLTVNVKHKWYRGNSPNLRLGERLGSQFCSIATFPSIRGHNSSIYTVTSVDCT